VRDKCVNPMYALWVGVISDLFKFGSHHQSLELLRCDWYLCLVDFITKPRWQKCHSS